MSGILSTLPIAALAVPAVLSAQTGQFLVRLGRDTLAIEQYTRTADRLEAEQVIRSPRTVHRIYTATFGRGGAVQRFELITHNVTGGPGPLERRATATFTDDSAVMIVPRGDSSATIRVKTTPGTVPFVDQGWGLVEEVARRARNAGSAPTCRSLPSARQYASAPACDTCAVRTEACAAVPGPPRRAGTQGPSPPPGRPFRRATTPKEPSLPGRPRRS